MVGEGTCCLYQIEAGNTLRAVPTALTKRESQGYTCHAWLLDGDAAGGGGEAALAVGTKRGEVLIVGQGEVKQVLALEDGAAVESLAAHSKVGLGAVGLRLARLPWKCQKLPNAGLHLCPVLDTCLPICHRRALWWAPAGAHCVPTSATATASPTACSRPSLCPAAAAVLMPMQLHPLQPHQAPPRRR